MKKILLLVVAVLFTTTAFAQNFSVGGRVGSGVQAVGQYSFGNDNYVEARFGTYWANNGGYVTADFTALYNWRIFNMDWTPRTGRWFFDAGCGLNVGGKANYAYVGAALMARLGLTFNDAPVSLSLDWTPAFGPGIFYGSGWSDAVFNEFGLASLGITCTYNF